MIQLFWADVGCLQHVQATSKSDHRTVKKLTVARHVGHLCMTSSLYVIEVVPRTVGRDFVGYTHRTFILRRHHDRLPWWPCAAACVKLLSITRQVPDFFAAYPILPCTKQGSGKVNHGLSSCRSNFHVQTFCADAETLAFCNLARAEKNHALRCCLVHLTGAQSRIREHNPNIVPI